MSHDQETELQAVLSRSPIVAAIVDRWSEIRLPDCWLVAGCLAQTVWNEAFGLPATHGISDVDLVYFDGDDLSQGAEAAMRRGSARCSPISACGSTSRTRRVCTFGMPRIRRPLAPYVSTEDAITTFPTTATALGVDPGANGLHVFAPYGLSDLLGRFVRHKKQITRAIHEVKVKKWGGVGGAGCAVAGPSRGRWDD